MKIIIGLLTLGISWAAIAGGGGTTTGIGGGFRTNEPAIVKDRLTKLQLSGIHRSILDDMIQVGAHQLRGDLAVLGVVKFPASQPAIPIKNLTIEWPSGRDTFRDFAQSENPWSGLIALDQVTVRGARSGDFVVAFKEQIERARKTNTRINAFVVPAKSLSSPDADIFTEALNLQKAAFYQSR